MTGRRLEAFDVLRGRSGPLDILCRRSGPLAVLWKFADVLRSLVFLRYALALCSHGTQHAQHSFLQIPVKKFTLIRLRGSHRLNMEVDLQSLFGLHVTWCARLYSLAETAVTPSYPSPIPPHWDSCTRALLVNKDSRRHLFVTPWRQLRKILILFSCCFGDQFLVPNLIKKRKAPLGKLWCVFFYKNTRHVQCTEAEFMNVQFLEGSGKNLESSQTWGFCLQCLHF